MLHARAVSREINEATFHILHETCAPVQEFNVDASTFQHLRSTHKMMSLSSFSYAHSLHQRFSLRWLMVMPPNARKLIVQLSFFSYLPAISARSKSLNRIIFFIFRQNEYDYGSITTVQVDKRQKLFQCENMKMWTFQRADETKFNLKQKWKQWICKINDKSNVRCYIMCAIPFMCA